MHGLVKLMEMLMEIFTGTRFRFNGQTTSLQCKTFYVLLKLKQRLRDVVVQLYVGNHKKFLEESF